MPEEGTPKTDISFLPHIGWVYYAENLPPLDFYNLAYEFGIPSIEVVFEFWRCDRVKDFISIAKALPIEDLMVMVNRDLVYFIADLHYNNVNSSVIKAFATFLCEIGLKDINLIPLHFPLPSKFKENFQEFVDGIIEEGYRNAKRARADWN